MAAKQAPYVYQSPTQPAPPTKEEAPTAPAEVTTEETQTEAKAETAEATEVETDEVLSPEAHSLDPKLQAKIDRRIGKEVAKRKEMETKMAALEARLAQQPAEVEKEVHVPVTATPLAEYDTLEKLTAYKDNLATDIIEAEGLLYGDFPADGLETKWGKLHKNQLITMLTEAKKIERSASPAREKFLTTRSQVAQTAQEKFSFLKDPSHPGYLMAKQALRENPILNNYPNRDYLVGMIVKGQLAMQAEEGTAPKVVVKPKQTPTRGQSEMSSDASIARAPLGAANKSALDVEIAKITGGKKSLDAKQYAAMLVAKQRFRNSQ